jgi:FtsH-binding integral membrane protein
MMLFQAGAALNALSHSPILLQNLSLLPALEFVASALWALLFLTLAVQVWNKRHDVVRRMTWALLVWMGYSLIRIIVFARADYDRGRIPFLVVAVVTGSALILTIMLRRHHDGASSSTGVTDYDRSQD